MALVIKEQEVLELITPADAFECVRQAHIALALSRATNSVRSRARTPEASIHVLEAASTELGQGGAKVYAAGRGGMQSHFLLYDLARCSMLAVIEANELGRLRTAAASAVAASLLCPHPASTMAIVGSGFQAEGLARAFADESAGLHLQRILIGSRSSEHAAALAEKLSKSLKQTVEAGETEAVCSNAEVIATATTSARPVLEDGWLPLCRLLCAVGANSLARSEIPPRAVTRARTVVVDSVAVAKEEGGNLLAPIENGKLLWNQCLELGDLLAGVRPVKYQESGYTLFCSHGLAVQDLYLAALVYKRRSGEI